ncbi:hypothetical protein [Flavobacterium sp. PL02]|uniref:hypothetical protein n=1 Tax=Flavobacterium sp. PL02 TaxID=3088354 RepID=UPI002B2347D6|nr:hypothetical protein [Flavobacterium sp. PL02]MEA9414397.1 hypothetical protein [Flavobacterium sp. PL02]
MKKIFLFLLLAVSFTVVAQKTYTIEKPLQLNTVNEGVKSDSILVRGADKIVKYVPISTIKSTTNLDYLATPSGGTVFSSSGNDAIVPLVTATNAGLQSPEDKIKHDVLVVSDATNVKNAENFTSGRIPYTTGVKSLADSNKLLWDNTNTKMTLTGSRPDITFIESLNSYSLSLMPIRNQFSAFFSQPFYASDQGYNVFRPSGTNISSRFYIMPNGNPTGTTSKFEMFNCDYFDNYMTYQGFNILMNNTSNEINIGPNRGVSGAARQKMIIGGDYTGSQLLGNPNQLIFNTDNTVNLNPFGGAFSFGSLITDPFSISLAHQVTFKNPVVGEPMRVNIIGNGWAAGLYFGRDAIRTASIATQATLSDLEISTNPTNAGNGLTANMRFFSNSGNVKVQNGGTYTDNGSRFQVNGNITADAATTANQVVVKSQLDALGANVIHNTGDETKAGSLTITSSGLPAVSGYHSGNGIGVLGNSLTGDGLRAISSSGIGLRVQNANGNTSSLAEFGTLGIASKIDYLGNITGNSFIKTGGLPTQSLMADGSVSTILSGRAVLNFPSVAAGATSDLAIAVTGASIGDVVSIGVDYASVLAGIQYTAWVSAIDTVTIRCGNLDLVTARDPASGTFKVKVFK